MSSPDLAKFPAMKTHDGVWMMVSYAASPSGELARDAHGQLIPAWAWLATGSKANPRFYKWNPEGEVFQWSDAPRHWEYKTTCQPQESSGMRTPRMLLPKCSPDLK